MPNCNICKAWFQTVDEVEKHKKVHKGKISDDMLSLPGVTKTENGELVIENLPVGRHTLYYGCIVENCDKSHYAKGLCHNHYMQIKRRPR